MKNIFLIALNVLLLLGGNVAASCTIEEKLEKVDDMIQKGIDTLLIPGAAVAIVVDGNIVFAKGFGVCHQVDQTPVTEDTVFAIGSCSKAFTTFALGQLVDEGKIGWDDPVLQHLPEFRLNDIHATHHLTIKDLVTHRSGLPRHDFLWYKSELSRAELLKRIEHLEPTSDLREKFQYNNLMYAVAGLIVERVTGQTWEEFVQNRIFDPLAMHRSNFSVDDSQQTDNFASPHRERKEQLEVIPFCNLSNIGPAGSINSSASDMAKWLQVHLCEGQLEGKKYIDQNTLREMYVVQTPLGSPLFDKSPYIFGYGLGWMTGLHKGHYTVMHDGMIDGFLSSVVLFPSEKIGIVVLTNSDSHGVFHSSAAYGIADILLEKEEDGWLGLLEENVKQIRALLKETEDKPPSKESKAIRDLESYIGQYTHPGYGTVHVSLEQEELIASYNNLFCILKHKCYDQFTLFETGARAELFPCSFVPNPLGEIKELHIPMEASLPPIVFTRQIANELVATEYLKKFVGAYECPVFSIEITLKQDHLIATILGQPPYKLNPEKLNLFSLKGVPDCSLEFVLKADEVPSLQLHQRGLTFELEAQAKECKKTTL